MSGSLTIAIIVSGFLLWSLYLYYQYRVAKAEATDTFAAYKEDGTLAAHVSSEDYSDMYLKTEGPRFGSYLFVTALVVAASILIVLRLFNLIWNFVWLRTGKLGWFDVGELPHSLATVFLYVGIMFVTMWFSMQHYHKTAPGQLRNEIKRLNESAQTDDKL